MDKITDVMSKINPTTVFNIQIGSIKIGITDSTISMWIAMAIIIAVAYIMAKKLKQMPSGKQSAVEIFVEFIRGILKDSMDKYSEVFVPFIGTMFLLLVVANIMDIVNIIIPSFNISPPTKNISVVLALSIISMITVVYAGIRFKKFSGWLKSFVQPLPIMLPFKIMEYFIKPISLTLRLFGNIVAGFLIMILIYAMIPEAIPSFASIYFDIFDGILQAYIFVFLTALYIGEAVEEED